MEPRGRPNLFLGTRTIYNPFLPRGQQPGDAMAEFRAVSNEALATLGEHGQAAPVAEAMNEFHAAAALACDGMQDLLHGQSAPVAEAMADFQAAAALAADGMQHLLHEDDVNKGPAWDRWDDGPANAVATSGSSSSSDSRAMPPPPPPPPPPHHLMRRGSNHGNEAAKTLMHTMHFGGQNSKRPGGKATIQLMIRSTRKRAM